MSYQAIRDAGINIAYISNSDKVTSSEPEWSVIARSKRLERRARIPESWRLPQDLLDQCAAHPITVFHEPIDPRISPGILSTRELELTNPKHDAVSLCEQLRSGDVSSEDLVVAFCKRAAIAHQLTNCLSEIMFEQAISLARDRDQAMKTSGVNNLGPLHGLPISFKDLYYVKNFDACIGITALANKPVATDSQIVSMLQNYGAIVIAKTTVPQTMLCGETESVVWGRTCNAYRGDFTTSGSSGGEGALVAMGGSAIGFGTDGAGSVRMPAFVNGIVGYKPSAFRWPLDGTNITNGGPGGSLTLGFVAVTGSLCRSVRDAAMIERLISKAEPWHINPMLLPFPWFELKAPAKLMRIGVWRNFDHVHPMPPVARAFELAQRRLKEAGHILVPFEGPSIEEVWPLMYEWTEACDLRYLRNLVSNEPMMKTNRIIGLLEPEKPFPQISPDQQNRLYDETNKLLFAMTAQWNKDAEPLDTLLWLPGPHPAVPFDEYNDLTMTCLFNMIDWPAITLPMNEHVNKEDLRLDGPDESKLWGEEDRRIKRLWDDNRTSFEGLPLSVQLIGRRGQCEKLLAVAEVVHDIIKS